MAGALSRLMEDHKKSPTHAAAIKREVAEAVKAKQLTLKDLDYNRLFFEAFGYGQGMTWLRDMDSPIQRLEENAGAISTAAFQDLTDPFVQNVFIEAYNLPAAEFSALIPEQATTKRWEIIRGVGQIGDEAQVVGEGKEFPEVGMSADWIQTPEVLKRGMTVSVTKETILFDETGLVLQRAQNAIEYLRWNREKRAINCVIDAGESGTEKYRYIWQGTSYATYQTSTPWINSFSNTLSDYGDVQDAWMKLLAMTDPQTGEPIMLEAKHMVVPAGLATTTMFALTGSVSRAAPGYATSGNPTKTEIANPVQTLIGNIQVVGQRSQLLRSTLGNDTTWFLGDLTKAFVYKQAIPFTVKNQGEDGYAGFQRDIVQRWRVSEMGTYATIQPRAIIKST